MEIFVDFTNPEHIKIFDSLEFGGGESERFIKEFGFQNMSFDVKSGDIVTALKDGEHNDFRKDKSIIPIPIDDPNLDLVDIREKYATWLHKKNSKYKTS